MVNVKIGQLTLGGQFDAYKRGQLGRNIHFGICGTFCAFDEILINKMIDRQSREIILVKSFLFCFMIKY